MTKNRKLAAPLRSLLVTEEVWLRDERSIVNSLRQAYEDRVKSLLDVYEKMELEDTTFVSILREERATSLTSRIETLTLEGHEHPFFSEATLYELVGKEQARTLLGLMEQIRKELN